MRDKKDNSSDLAKKRVKESVELLEKIGLLGEETPNDTRILGTFTYTPISNKPKTLVVDDSRVIRENMASILEMLGVPFVMVTNGQEAIDSLVNDTSIRMVFMDINMPVLNGISTLKELKHLEIHKRVQIVMLTTMSTKELVLEAKLLGAAGWVIKPPKFDQIKKIYQKYFKNSFPESADAPKPGG